jgi:hypothetical protein
MEKEPKREEKEKAKVKEHIQRGGHMFLSDIGKRIEEDELLLKRKIELKAQRQYTIDNQ